MAWKDLSWSADWGESVSLELRPFILEFVSQLYRKIGFLFSKAKRQNPERKTWVQGYGSVATLHASTFGMQAHFQL